MALTLEQELEHLDNQLAAMRQQREASHDNAERARLQRQIESLNVHERAAIKQHHAERAAKRAAEEKAADAFLQHQADQQEAESATPADRAEYRKALELYPDLSKDHGELPKMYNMFALEMFQGQSILEESVKHRLKVMRAELAGATPSALEILLVDVVLST